MNVVIKNTHNEFYRPNMRGPVFGSVVFHVLVFTLATVGLPFLAHAPEREEQIITVQLFDLAEINQTIEIAPMQNNDNTDPGDVPAKPVYNQSSQMPDLLSPQAPDVEEVTKPEESRPEEKIAEIADPTEITRAPLPVSKPKPPKKEDVVKREEKPDVKPEPQIEDKPAQSDFTSLLKTLTDNTESTSSKRPEPDFQTDVGGNKSQLAPLADSLSSNEMNSFLGGVSPCWNVDAGMIYSPDLVVVLDVRVNEERRVISADILPEDQARYRSNARFAAAADSAKRALLDSRCRVLRLPEDKYHLWKEFSFTFNPSGMLR